jgi:thiopurine S-methyltransferase
MHGDGDSHNFQSLIGCMVLMKERGQSPPSFYWSRAILDRVTNRYPLNAIAEYPTVFASSISHTTSHRVLCLFDQNIFTLHKAQMKKSQVPLPALPETGLADQDNHLWLEFWRDERTDFHQSAVNPLLSKFWSGLELTRGSRVFVPLCGKSLDMLWLAQQGHEVIGVELSPIAVADFFRENHLQPVKRQIGMFTLWSAGRISILCGDYFALAKTDLGRFDTVYDRSALTALPENIRGQYVAQLRQLVPDTARGFLLTVEDAAENASMQQANGVDEEIRTLFSAGFEIDLTYVESVFEADTDAPELPAKRAEHKVYRLSAK